MEPGRGTFDPDLDLQPRREASDSNEPGEEYQRLVANPFLAILAWVVMLGMLRESLRRQNLALFVAGIVVLFGAFFLLHFHCLDCGKTGWLIRCRSHACSAVVARRHNKTVRRFHGPGLKIQLVVWFVCVIAAYVLGIVALRARR